jgi:hypothetical protein
VRELGIGLPTIARVLARELTVAEVARAQADALEATVRTLRLRQAVLRAVSVRDTDWEELELMNRLARLDAEGRRRILDEFVDRTYDGLEDEHHTVEALREMMRGVFPDLPQDPTERQVEAWVDLVELVQGADFIERSRQMAIYSVRKRAKLDDEQWKADHEAFGEILAPSAQEAYAAVVAGLEVMNDKRVNRFWELVGIVGDSPVLAAGSGAL